MQTLPKLTRCAHVTRGERKPIAMMALETTGAWEHEPVNDISALCVACTARVISLITTLETGDTVDP
ncbi:MAG TPA: hypothetical protein VK524_34505 [Polyangiaceae bacterium]|nr:hypothetical protein [Polyangiaceae bacterium]